MDSLREVISDLSTFFYSGLVNLPMTIGGTMLLLGLFTANYAMLIFLMGFLIVVPIFHWGWNYLLTRLAMDYYPSGLSPLSDVCGIIVPFTGDGSNVSGEKQVTSQWVAMVSFFFGYILQNAVVLFIQEPEPATAMEVTETQVTEINNKTSYRRTQAVVSMITVIIAIIVILTMRYQTGCDGALGISLGAVPMGVAGLFWYNMQSAVGQGRVADLFGIANRLLPPSAIANGPIACMR